MNPKELTDLYPKPNNDVEYNQERINVFHHKGG